MSKEKSAIQVAEGIMSNKKKFTRLLLILIIIAVVLCVGFYTGAISWHKAGAEAVKAEQPINEQN